MEFKQLYQILRLKFSLYIFNILSLDLLSKIILMKRLYIVFILFFIISNNSFGQSCISENVPEVNTQLQDTIVYRVMNFMTKTYIDNAKLQIQGAGAKEKFESYSNFIKKESDLILNTFTHVVIPELYQKYFSDDEIKEIHSFYQTVTGKKSLAQLFNIFRSPSLEQSKNIENSNNQFTAEESEHFVAFKKTTAGSKLFLEMDAINKELTILLSEKHLPEFQQKLKKELARLDSKIWREAYRVKPEQIIVYDGEFSGDKKIIRIQKDTKKRETYVTFAVPIYENKFWIRFDKNTNLVDKKTNEHYLALRLENDLILNKTMIVSDQKMKMIEVTIAFPLLKESVKEFDIIQKTSEDADLMSNNAAPWSKNTLVDLKLKKYLVKNKSVKKT